MWSQNDAVDRFMMFRNHLLASSSNSAVPLYEAGDAMEDFYSANI